MNGGETSIALVVRCQSLFRAFAVADFLPIFQRDWLEQVTIPLQSLGTVHVRGRIGRGPISEPLGVTAMLYFLGSDDPYPEFSFPSEGPTGAGVHATSVALDVNADEHTVLFLLEAAVGVPVAPDTWEEARKNELTESSKGTVRDPLRQARSIVDTLAGAYALYQYPLVWAHIHQRDLYLFVNLATKEVTQSRQEIVPDNFVPFKLDPSALVKDGVFSDAVISKGAELVAADLTDPLGLLKDSLWHSDLRTRFLLQFWIVEHLAERHAAHLPRDEQMRAFVKTLEGVVANTYPEYLERFNARKGELTRPTLAEKLRVCCDDLRIEYDDKTFRLAKKVRDNLSHGAHYLEDELRSMDQFIRELARHMLRRELESRGVFLSGNPRPFGELPVIEPSFLRMQREQRKTAKFDLGSGTK